ncbi:cytochrome P450 [Nonomuraea sp. NPDC023979]|uniref:cytochrome P450 n=1 Tax=Nonomuraea sp. NPDC023979 TaxID=3154796 RepID=UPI0033BFFEA0
MTVESSTWPWVDLPPGPDGTPSPAVTRRQESAPIAPVRMPSGDQVPMLVRYDDVRAMLACPASSRIFSEDDPVMVAGMSSERVPDVLLNMDPPEHTRLRRLMQGPFSVRQSEQWRTHIRTIAHDLIDHFGSPFDLVADYAMPLSSRALCRVVGIPADDYGRFHRWTTAFLSTSDASAETRAATLAALVDYAATLISRRREAPGEDLIDLMIQARDQQDRMSEGELVNMLLMLIVAGHETLTLMISRTVYRLLRTNTYTELVRNPSLIGPAVEEALRYEGPGANGVLRRAREDITLPSGKLPEGSVVLASPSAANHDPHAFTNPARFDIRRYTDSATRAHLAFGHGPHYCLGANLARMELQESLRALLDRLPALRPAIDLDEVPWTVEATTHRPVKLLLRGEPGVPSAQP